MSDTALLTLQPDDGLYWFRRLWLHPDPQSESVAAQLVEEVAQELALRPPSVVWFVPEDPKKASEEWSAASRKVPGSDWGIDQNPWSSTAATHTAMAQP